MKQGPAIKYMTQSLGLMVFGFSWGFWMGNLFEHTISDFEKYSAGILVSLSLIPIVLAVRRLVVASRVCDGVGVWLLFMTGLVEFAGIVYYALFLFFFYYVNHIGWST